MNVALDVDMNKFVCEDSAKAALIATSFGALNLVSAPPPPIMQLVSTDPPSPILRYIRL